MSSVRVFDAALLDGLSDEARKSPRLRAHHLIHRDHCDLHQRLLIALEPGTYVRPHRHSMPSKDETFVVLRGEVELLVFDDVGRVSEQHVLGADAGAPCADVASGAWHALVCTAPQTIVLEAKAGPFAVIAAGDWPPWCGVAGTDGSQAGRRSPKGP